MGGHLPSSSETDLPAEVIQERQLCRGALKQSLTRNPARPGGGAIDNILEKPSVSWNPKCPLKRITISPNPEWKKQLQPPERSHITGTKKAKIVGQKPSASSSGNRDRDRSILRLLEL